MSINKVRTLVMVSAMVLVCGWLSEEAASQQMGVPVSGSVVDVRSYGAIADDSGDDTTAISRAIKVCERGPIKTLYFPVGTFNLLNITFPKGVSVVVPHGALLQIDQEATVCFCGPFSAGLYQVFSDTGKVNFGSGAVQEVYPQWWPSPGGDDSIAIKKAVDSAPDLPGITVRLAGIFNCKSTILVNRDRAHILGNGQYVTQLTFAPAADGPLFVFKKDNKTPVVQCAIRDLALMGATDNPHQKVGIKIVDADIIEVRNIAIQRWISKQSIGLQIQGRDFGYIENVSIVADLPISIEKDPNIDWISIDHFTFRNMYLITWVDENPAIKIGSGVYLTNVVFEGTNSWCWGKYGIYWKDTECKGTSLNLVVRNVRMEQGKAPGGHIIHIDNNYAMQNLILENIYGCEGGPGGIYLRNCSNVTLENVFYTNGGKYPEAAPLDIDESCSKVVLINSFWNVGNPKKGRLIETFGSRLTPQQRSRPLEVLDKARANSPHIEGIVVDGTKTWCHSGKLAKGEVLALPIGFGLAMKVATISVTATDGDGIIESGQFAATKTKTVLVSGTKRLGTEAASGKLSLVAGNQVQLINHLGTDVDIVVTMFWQ